MTITRIREAFKSPSREFLILILAIVGVGLFQALPGPKPLDDSYITFRYARNIQAGLGFVYNPGEFVQGTTTPIYTLILAFLAILFGPTKLPEISFGIAILADFINTWLLFRISKHILRHAMTAFILAVVFLLQPQRLNVAAGGMETSLLITAILAMYDCHLIGKKPYSAAIWGALAILIRPDAILAVIPVIIHLVWKNRTIAGKALLLGIAILTPWYIWATWYFGNPIPFSILAKTATYQNYSAGETLSLILTFLGTGTVGPYRDQLIILPGLIVAIFLIIFGLRWIMKNNPESLIVIIYPLLYFLVMTIRRAPLFFSWYYLPLMPGLLLIFFSAFRYLVQPLKSGKQKILYGFFTFTLVFFPAILMQVFPGWSSSREIETLYHQASESIVNQSAKKLVFAPDIGVIGWNLPDAKILDPIGLVSPISLEYLERFVDPAIAKKALIKDLKPDFVVAQEWFIFDLTKDPEFLADYQLIWQKESVQKVSWQQISGVDSTIKVLIFQRK
jgi:hypothetical protein